jgi:hypothetical protein
MLRLRRSALHEARSPAADHKVAPPQVDVRPCHGWLQVIARYANDENRHLLVERNGGKRKIVERDSSFPNWKLRGPAT